MFATSVGNSEIVKLLLDNGADTKLTDSSGKSLLMIAANGGHYEVVKLFLTLGLEVNCQKEASF